MTKDTIVKSIVERTGIERSIVTDIIESMMDVIIDKVAQGEHIVLPGFGVFKPKRRAYKIARNLNTGEPVEVPEHDIPYFSPSADFKIDSHDKNRSKKD